MEVMIIHPFSLLPIREDHGNVGLLELKSVHPDFFREG